MSVILLQFLHIPVFQGEKKVNLHYLHCCTHSLMSYLFSYSVKPNYSFSILAFSFSSTWSSLHRSPPFLQFSAYIAFPSQKTFQSLSAHRRIHSEYSLSSLTVLMTIFTFVFNGVLMYLMADTSLVCEIHDSRDPSACSSTVSPVLYT